MVPNFINAMHPTNMANAVRASNLQGAADTALQRVAAHPRVTAFGDLAKDWRDEKKRRCRRRRALALKTERSHPVLLRRDATARGALEIDFGARIVADQEGGRVSVAPAKQTRAFLRKTGRLLQ